MDRKNISTETKTLYSSIRNKCHTELQLFNLFIYIQLSATSAVYIYARYMSLLLLCAGDVETNPGPNPSNLKQLTKRQKQQIRKEKDRMRKQSAVKVDKNDQKNHKESTEFIHTHPVILDVSSDTHCDCEYELASPTNVLHNVKDIGRTEGIDGTPSEVQMELTKFVTPFTVILGHFSQADSRFGTSHGQQCTCNAITLLCVWQSNKDLTRDDIDATLYEGDKVFRELSSLLRQTGMSSQQYRYLDFREIELLSPLKIFDHQYTIKLSDCLTGAIHSVTTSDRSIYGLADAISFALAQNPQALMMIESYAMAIVKTSGKVGLFDSHAHSQNGSFNVADGCAAFMLFRNEIAVANFLKQNFPGHSQYDIHPVEITFERYDNSGNQICDNKENTRRSFTENKGVPIMYSDNPCQAKKLNSDTNLKRSLSTNRKQTCTKSHTDEEDHVNMVKHIKLQSKNSQQTAQSKPGLNDIPEQLQHYFSDQLQRSRSAKDQKNIINMDTNDANSHSKMKKTVLKPSRAEYMKAYMQKKRRDCGYREKERLSKCLARENPNRRAKERHQENVSKKIARKDTEVREKEI